MPCMTGLPAARFMSVTSAAEFTLKNRFNRHTVDSRVALSSARTPLSGEVAPAPEGKPR